MYETKKIDELLAENNVDPNVGLTSEEAAQRLATFGKNKLVEKKRRSIFLTFLMQLNDPMIYILLAAALISALVTIFGEGQDDWADVIIILAVVLLNATIGTIQEIKAENALEALKKLSSPTATVRRDGRVFEIKAEDLVVGDIVVLEEGRSIGADMRLLKEYNLKTDESSLTGESTPIEKNYELVFSEPVGVGDRLNSVYMSTPIVYGHGEGIVVATGEKTEIGKIAKMLADEKEEATPLQKRLADLSKILGIITIVIIGAIFVVALVQQRNPLEMFITAISLAVAAVPEGLPAVVTIVLALGVQRMVKVNTIVRRLPSVETLGAVSVVCSDKTGTLTQNKMTVVRAFANHEIIDPEHFQRESVSFLARGMALCSNASIDSGVYGDPTEIALVEFAKKIGLCKKDLDCQHPRINELPFDSVRKMMSTHHEHTSGPIVFTKGALDSVIKHTTHILIDGKVRPITKDDLKKISDGSAYMARNALRVLALAYKESTELSEDNLTFVGLVGMADPPRPEAGEAVAIFKKAGIVTVMITGDHRDTALAIARELKIAEEESQVLSGDELSKMSFDELRQAVKTVRVFARVSPENKVSIVKAIKANGYIAAMTGDGVNDAPSLKSADIGIAMGITGTDVAKGAADMVLTDDNFASIEKAVEEGRGIYANIKKTVYFLLSSNIGEVISMFVAIVLGLPVPLIAIHILWVNLITDSLPAIALGADEKADNIMEDKPRDEKESLFARGGYFFIVTYGIAIAAITLFGFLVFPAKYLLDAGLDLNLANITAVLDATTTIGAEVPDMLMKAQSVAFSVLGISQLFHMLGMTDTKKSFVHIFKSRNWLLLVAFVFGLGMQILITEIPFLENFFDTAELTLVEWLDVIGLSVVPLAIHEIIVLIKFIQKKVRNKRIAKTNI
ncbi:MAG: calcium-translocating P-type ATPase, PMCA-type [Bacilli bacterium]|jgi:Ca2+-transporting ATPase